MIERSQELIEAIIFYSTFSTSVAVVLYSYLIFFTNKNKVHNKLIDILTYIILYQFTCLFIFCQSKGFKHDPIAILQMLKIGEICAMFYFFNMQYWILPLIILDYHFLDVHLLILFFLIIELIYAFILVSYEDEDYVNYQTLFLSKHMIFCWCFFFVTYILSDILHKKYFLLLSKW